MGKHKKDKHNHQKDHCDREKAPQVSIFINNDSNANNANKQNAKNEEKNDDGCAKCCMSFVSLFKK